MKRFDNFIIHHECKKYIFYKYTYDKICNYMQYKIWSMESVYGANMQMHIIPVYTYRFYREVHDR